MNGTEIIIKINPEKEKKLIEDFLNSASDTKIMIHDLKTNEIKVIEIKPPYQ
jgi:hypothetical protein